MTLKILIAEDDTVCRMLLLKILQAVPSVEILEAHDGEEAWEILNEDTPPDLCIFDNVMPGASGLELMERMQGDSRLASIPVFLSSISNNREEVLKALDLNAAGFITKPINEEKVLKMIKPALDKLMS